MSSGSSLTTKQLTKIDRYRVASNRTSSATVGVVGAGQLARMLYEAASPLGIQLRILAERTDDSAALIASNVSLGSPRSLVDLASFTNDNDVITFDHELVNSAALASLETQGHRLAPSAAVIALVQDKLAQRQTLSGGGFPVPDFQSVSDASEIAAFGDERDWPVVAKAVRGGYDGRGVWVLPDSAAAARFGDAFDWSSGPVLVESFVSIERELAVLVARRPNGDTGVFPVVETVQVDGICREILAPASVSPILAAEAQRLAVEIATFIGATGILAIELFASAHGLVVNELAARPHNSGHYTIEGCATSQFEQHLRSILDWPLGSTDLVAPAVATVNVLGHSSGADPLTRLPLVLADGRVRVHLYGKQARPGRKLGHVTVLAGDLAEARATARQAAAYLSGDESLDQWET